MRNQHSIPCCRVFFVLDVSCFGWCWLVFCFWSRLEATFIFVRHTAYVCIGFWVMAFSVSMKSFNRCLLPQASRSSLSTLNEKGPKMWTTWSGGILPLGLCWPKLRGWSSIPTQARPPGWPPTMNTGKIESMRSWQSSSWSELIFALHVVKTVYVGRQRGGGGNSLAVQWLGLCAVRSISLCWVLSLFY